MCKAKPQPRCLGHAQADLDKHHESYPDLARLTDAQLRAAHAQALGTRQPAKGRILARELDLRLDRDATAEGLKVIKAELDADSTNADLWYRYNAASATITAKMEYAAAPQPLHPREINARTLVERRERLARIEGRAAATLAARGELAPKDISNLVAEYEAVLEADAQARLVANQHRPDQAYVTASDLRSWRGAVAGMKDGLVHMARGADEFAARSHKAAAIETWGYPPHVPARPFGATRDLTAAPLEAVRVAVLARVPVKYEVGQIKVESTDQALRAKLWHAGYPIVTPVGQIVIRANGPLSAAA